MAVVYPRKLYVRIDKGLQAALIQCAEEAGESVSVYARRHLLTAVGLPAEPAPAAPDPEQAKDDLSRAFSQPVRAARTLKGCLGRIDDLTREDIRTLAARLDAHRRMTA
ncbi:hypothetical protein SAMN02799631_05890 [Methylobacterium sp. 174MFSha1.1]|uniref:hypothetical protein n=1 Tax=Methylobacterium sp. 174MFSha1.1 TaxID=1502749 RepID=UPI0008E07EFB|nr:hypothetical protein [Methylobacterium sp. 174MFSha1.1]SFV14516.1 hypothetical protein SAMN02799631_05890 [Methylobacterium sp. 174MFSha1.1]